MNARAVKIGIALIILLAMIPLYYFFNPAAAKEKAANSKNEKSELAAKESTAQKSQDEKKETANEYSKKDPEEAAAVNNGDESLKEESVTSEKASSEEKKEIQRDFLVVIDPGHQRHANLGKEPVGPGAVEMKMKVTGGTSGVATGKPEYQLALEASVILGDLLAKQGVKVIYTRTTHDVNLSNKERAEFANQHKADLFIRIHADGSTDKNVSGLSVLTPAHNDPYTKAIYEDSLKASELILAETKKNTSVKVNGISYRSDLSGFNWSQVPSTLIEMGFMSNPVEDRNLSDPTYLTNLLSNVADGILQYASLKK
ncbi:N-acetylmuramoyl-L-alanine amidase family protein [Neobacillus vireti]|uniref:N-acetylmuramoyl-L-alanine amidase n=1 Tax=Neobacillus vireti LMG 21834 TaxID=1131730 RepID=A0AB94IQ87_9BACI|nr:N-acetylmuramoyl-L-alanine amidase [Neobacillus vireti]ETI69128.1 N-acetylmuramoyl-L-alanine amidase [Neobacillus vireti LMG 21834]